MKRSCGGPPDCGVRGVQFNMIAPFVGIREWVFVAPVCKRWHRVYAKLLRALSELHGVRTGPYTWRYSALCSMSRFREHAEACQYIPLLKACETAEPSVLQNLIMRHIDHRGVMSGPTIGRLFELGRRDAALAVLRANRHLFPDLAVAIRDSVTTDAADAAVCDCLRVIGYRVSRKFKGEWASEILRLHKRRDECVRVAAARRAFAYLRWLQANCKKYAELPDYVAYDAIEADRDTSFYAALRPTLRNAERALGAARAAGADEQATRALIEEIVAIK